VEEGLRTPNAPVASGIDVVGALLLFTTAMIAVANVLTYMLTGKFLWPFN